MASLFWRQFKGLSNKNAIGFRNHWLANLLRCLLFPIAYGIFLSFAPTFFTTPNAFGVGSASSVFRVQDHFDGSKPIFWVDNTDGSGYISAKDIMDRVTSDFTANQRASVIQLPDDVALGDNCKSNFNGGSACYITVTFDFIPGNSSLQNEALSLNYTIRSDNGVNRVDVNGHSSDLETRLIPMQWAIDQAVIELTTGQQYPLPLSLPFTHETNADIYDTSRLVFVSLVGSFVGIAFLVAFIGVVYQLAGGVALERASLLTSHMQAMGALDSARILSWYLCVSVLYLPAWIILALIWRSQLFTRTNVGLMILAHLIAGFSLASWSLFVSVPFRKSAQLAAVVATLLALVLGVVPLVMFEEIGTTTPTVLSFFFPPMFYVFIIKIFAGFEVNQMSPSLSLPDPQYQITALPMVIAVLVSIFVWPCVAVYWERWLYGVVNPSNTGFWWRKKHGSSSVQPDISISLRNVRKTFNSSFFKRKSKEVVAIEDLSLDIPSHGIFVLLGPNGAGKSTTLSILGGLMKATGGEVTFSGSTARPPRGTLGIVPQRNVLFPELTCLQTLRVWNDIKNGDGRFEEEDLEKLIYDCDLQSKMHEPASTLSGGQKRKLQLAIGLVGGSKVILVDECTSGVDPLSRRSLWKTLTTYRGERTIILTTHFLDEADFLADRIAVLATPGKLIASDTPVAMKSSMGEGYTISVRFSSDGHSDDLLQELRTVAPETTLANLGTHANYHLKTKDTVVVANALRKVENLREKCSVHSYVIGTTIEEIFLDLLAKDKDEAEDAEEAEAQHQASIANLTLSNARPRSPWAQAMTIFYKRMLIVRRSWLIPLLAMAVGISGAWWPIRFVKGGLASCAHTPLRQFDIPPFFPPPFLSSGIFYAAPPSLIATLNASLPELFIPPPFEFEDGDDGDGSPNAVFNPFNPVANETALENQVVSKFRSISANGFNGPDFDPDQGGLAVDFDRNEYLIAYPMQVNSLDLFSMTTNLLYVHALNNSKVTHAPTRIISTFDYLPTVSSESLATLQWLAVFGAAMAVFPAFFSLYVGKERHSSVQAMQLSNGLSNPLGLWLGHFLFDSMFSVVVATVVAIIYSVVKHKFQGVGLLWLVMCLYGFAGTLLAYVAVILIKSPLGAFSALVVSQFIIYLLYLVGYIVLQFTGIPQTVPRNLNVIHFTLALVAPINSLVRAAMVSVNQFSLLCDGDQVITSGPRLVSITRYGGPILYLVLWIIFLLFLLGQVDSGVHLPWSKSPKRLFRLKEKGVSTEKPLNPDVLAEAEKAVLPSNDDPLRVLNISKSFKGGKVVDNVSFTISHNSLFVMLGPNGAGKTTTFDMIRGHLNPDAGDVKVNETSVLEDMKKARVSFGVCPQFTAMDAHLTVREHLVIYGRLRGLRGDELKRNIDDVMEATGVSAYSDRLATKLSGGNQRKLALAIALMGNPSVVLVDEYSTGIDARMKRELWAVLKQIAANKSVFLTTHSMEEASYLATKVGIMSKRMLAVGTPEELESRNASYEVHFACTSPSEMARVKAVMAKMPGARMVDDVATRFEVPVSVSPSSAHTTGVSTTFSSTSSFSDEEIEVQGVPRSKMMTVASIFEVLALEEGFPEFTVGKSSLETAFIRVINDDYARGYVDGEGATRRAKGRRLWHLFSS